VLETDDGTILDKRGRTIGVATNNVAEYRALIAGLEAALARGVGELDVVSDSELLVKQMRGEYKVKHAGLKPLHEQALRALADFERWHVRTVPRAQNAAADALVNAALDAIG